MGVCAAALMGAHEEICFRCKWERKIVKHHLRGGSCLSSDPANLQQTLNVSMW